MIRQIITHLESIFFEENEDEDSQRSSANDPNGMSLLDKMSMWDDKSNQTQPSGINDGLFEGVEDDDEDNPRELSAYNNIIVSSSAWHWLMDSLKREASFQIGSSDTKESTTVEIIRKQILEQLPTGKISKRRYLLKHAVAFRLPRQALCVRLSQERVEHNGSLKDIGDRSLVGTSSSTEEVNVTSIKEYTKKVWPWSLHHIIDRLHSTPLDTNDTFKCRISTRTSLNLILTTI